MKGEKKKEIKDIKGDKEPENEVFFLLPSKKNSLFFFPCLGKICLFYTFSRKPSCTLPLCLDPVVMLLPDEELGVTVDKK